MSPDVATQEAMRTQKERLENIPQTGAAGMTFRLQSHQSARAAQHRDQNQFTHTLWERMRSTSRSKDGHKAYLEQVVAVEEDTTGKRQYHASGSRCV